MRIHSRRKPEEANDPEAVKLDRRQITIEITGHGHRKFLLGSIAEIPRPGMVTIRLPPVEAWEEVLTQLPKVIRQRMSEPAFYQRLQVEVSKHMLHPISVTP